MKVHTNRLAREKSPYLLQHANNPVDWYAWGKEAFDKARAEQKPLFLSIGYSTCHWCHVMERESFENDEIARVLNASFVPVKVDREERPDVDRIYMQYVQATTGSGGWPMSVFLTPDLQPFYGGTYFPPDNRYGRPGFKSLLERIAQVWDEDRARIGEAAARGVVQLAAQAAAQPGPVDRGLVDTCYHVFRRNFDARWGGFGGAPKFPRPSVYQFLLRYGTEEAVEMTAMTLREMAKGGMHDQVGGGFHRYSVDERWFVPHFEKMLYDQAQLAIAYLEAFQVTRDESFADVARGIFEYVLRDLTHPDGGFYSAEDADSVIDPAEPRVKGEGAFYIWTNAELRELVDAEVLAWWGVEPGGNVLHDPHGEFQGRNILYQAHAGDVAKLREAKRLVLEARSRRPRPHLDDKVLTSWNALMISAFAKGAQALGEARYERAAERATEFVLRHLYKDGALLRRYRDGEAAVEGMLDDYAFFANALIDLYETGFEKRYLDLAAQLTETMRARFEDREDGGFFSTAAGAPDLLLRIKDEYDGAEPSGNSMAAFALLRLGLRDEAERTVRAFASRAADAASAMPLLIAAVADVLDAPREVVFAGETGGLLPVVRSRLLRNTRVLRAGDTPETAAMKATGVYVCQNFACQAPVNSADDLDRLLQ